jgi:hypothetical protein
MRNVDNRRATRRFRGILRWMLAGVAQGARAVSSGIFGSWCHGTILSVLLLAIVVAVGLGLTLPHPDIASDTDAAALVCNCLAERGTLHETRELLGAEDVEGLRVDFHAPVDASGHVPGLGLHIEILLFLCRLKQTKVELVKALVANRQVRENEVAGLIGTVQISHAGGWNTGQDRRVVIEAGLAWGLDAGISETGVKEEVGVVIESDVSCSFLVGTFTNTELDNRRGVNRASVAVGLLARTASSCALGLLEDRHFVPKCAVCSGNAAHGPEAFPAGVDRNC